GGGFPGAFPGTGLGAAQGALGGALGGGAAGAFGGALGGALAGAQRPVQAAGLPTTGAGVGGAPPGAVGGKALTLRFISALREGKIVESGFLDDVRMTPDIRTNSILLSAPPQTVDL